jgi:hypothetical protein
MMIGALGGLRNYCTSATPPTTAPFARPTCVALLIKTSPLELVTRCDRKRSKPISAGIIPVQNICNLFVRKSLAPIIHRWYTSHR